MANILKELIYTDDSHDNWFFKKYYCFGANHRYRTFQLALNLLAQRTLNPIIVETGCQRMIDDLGAGMSSSIFGEYCFRYGGKLYTVDAISQHLDTCKSCTSFFAKHIEYVLSDSIEWFKNTKNIKADLLYLDSVDYPPILTVSDLSNPVLQKEARISQEHSLNEFIAASCSGFVDSKTIILIDDNQLIGGGKPKLLKNYLEKNKWMCLMDFQQSLWVKSL